MDPGIFGEGLASAMSQWLWSTKTPTTTATPNTTFASFPTACGTGGICGIGDATVYPPKDWHFRTHNLKVPSFGESLKIPVYWHCAVVCREFEIIQSSPVCGHCVVVCEDFEFLKFTCMWALCCGTSSLCPSIGGIDFLKKVLIGISPLYWRDYFLGSKSL